ncbi:unnamed protein product [Polarella glacialis]|uniref:Uncharacterized protein n=1 Tax=Polarella glacialis TaxID=89957 RepID=A0A813KY72_POLGL|nr:unnamed protein product [Polarella glacialis]
MADALVSPLGGSQQPQPRVGYLSAASQRQGLRVISVSLPQSHPVMLPVWPEVQDRTGNIQIPKAVLLDVIKQGCCPVHLTMRLHRALRSTKNGVGHVMMDSQIRVSGCLGVLDKRSLAEVAAYFTVTDSLACRTCAREPLQWSLPSDCGERGLWFLALNAIRVKLKNQIASDFRQWRERSEARLAALDAALGARLTASVETGNQIESLREQIESLRSRCDAQEARLNVQEARIDALESRAAAAQAEEVWEVQQDMSLRGGLGNLQNSLLPVLEQPDVGKLQEVIWQQEEFIQHLQHQLQQQPGSDGFPRQCQKGQEHFRSIVSSSQLVTAVRHAFARVLPPCKRRRLASQHDGSQTNGAPQGDSSVQPLFLCPSADL